MHGIRSSAIRGALACATVLALGCGGSSGGGANPDPDLAGNAETLHGKAIFFGHQSVGDNIMGGLAAVLAPLSTAKPAIVSTSEASAVSAGVFAHAHVAANEHPDQKISNFRTLLTGSLGGQVDLAFLKFCFVDFQGDTWDDDAKVTALFAAYQQMVADVHDAHPALKLVHLTVPLSPADDPDNARRERFSAKLRAAYGEDVFDLAHFESTDPTTGKSIGGTNGPRLYSGWKDDESGHLNGAGSQAVATALVAFLAGK